MADSICTGSHLHRRTFQEDEYWPSFQSTIVAGQVMSAEEMTNAAETVTIASLSDQTTNVADLSSFVEDEVREDPWNMNIDAIGSPELPPDDDYYDCPSFEKSPANLVRPPSRVFNVVYSPRPYSQPQFYRVQFASPPDDNDNSKRKSNDFLASPRKRSATAKRISPRLMISHASNASSPGAEMKTGSYLVQMIDDFNDLEDHAQSTPKLSSDSGNPSSEDGGGSIFTSEVSQIDQLRKNLDADFQNAETVVVTSPPKSPKSPKFQPADVSASNKENFYDGKYTSFVNIRRGLEKKPSPKKLHTRAGKVALLKDFFQARVNDSIQLHKSRIPVPVRGRVKKSPQAKTRASGSPSFQCRSTYKLVSSRLSSGSSRSHPSTATTFSSSGCDSFLTRNQHKRSRTSRVQSCSDATNGELTSIDETCKSHSTGDLSSNSSASMKALQSSKITKRSYNLNVEEPSQESSVVLSPKKVSAINKRRSVGLQLKKNASPVKPVCELRKLFTPTKRARRNSGSQCSFNVTRKQASHLVVPKIVISHQ